MKLTRIAAALLAAAALSLPALAADLPVTKAPPAIAPVANPCSNLACSGFYLGAELSGAGTGVNIINLGSLNAGGTWMGGTAGYQFYNGTYWLGAKASIGYAVANPPGTIVGGFSDKIFAFEGVEFGGNVTQLFNIPPITLPGFLATAVPTILVGACQNGSMLKGYCAGAAAHFFIPNSRWTIDATYLNAQYGTTAIAPGQTASTENRGTFGFSYHF